jgi:hypothetical protein
MLTKEDLQNELMQQKTNIEIALQIINEKLSLFTKLEVKAGA